MVAVDIVGDGPGSQLVPLSEVPEVGQIMSSWVPKMSIKVLTFHRLKSSARDSDI